MPTIKNKRIKSHRLREILKDMKERKTAPTRHKKHPNACSCTCSLSTANFVELVDPGEIDPRQWVMCNCRSCPTDTGGLAPCTVEIAYILAMITGGTCGTCTGWIDDWCLRWLKLCKEHRVSSKHHRWRRLPTSVYMYISLEHVGFNPTIVLTFLSLKDNNELM